VQIAKGAAAPRSQAAELKKIEDIFNAALTSGQPLPISWLVDSLNAKEALDLPDAPADGQTDKAQLENHLMLLGDDVPVAYYDPPLVHIPIHREGQIQAELSGDVATWQRIEAHVQEHLLAAQENAAKIAPPPQQLSPGQDQSQSQPPQAPPGG
jgi:hypothetical protein